MENEAKNSAKSQQNASDFQIHAKCLYLSVCVSVKWQNEIVAQIWRKSKIKCSFLMLFHRFTYYNLYTICIIQMKHYKILQNILYSIHDNCMEISREHRKKKSRKNWQIHSKTTVANKSSNI